jgi:UTP--glucose-1-phosphate uridylyltransferase
MPLTCERYDCGSKLGYLEAIVNFVLSHPNYAEPFRTIISEKLTAKRD